MEFGVSAVTVRFCGALLGAESARDRHHHYPHTVHGALIHKYFSVAVAESSKKSAIDYYLLPQFECLQLQYRVQSQHYFQQ